MTPPAFGRWRSLVLVAGAGSVAACGAILGIDDVELIDATTPITTGAGGASATGVTSTAASGGGAGGEGGSGGSTSSSTGEGGAASSCQDGMLNGSETDVDCGGSECASCLGSSCTLGPDCASGHCVEGVCCDDDCTGLCLACTMRLTGQADGACAPVPADTDDVDECISPQADVCNGMGECRCYDGAMNGGETGLDCGGPCAPCGGNCSDSIQNNGESDVDCGGPCAKCPDGKLCANDLHCAGNACNAGICCTPDDDLTTCAAQCGNTTNNCGQPVACGTTCVPPIPATWGGPAVLYLGPAAMMVPSCPAAYPTPVVVGDAEINAPPAICSPCACGAVADESCVGASISGHLSGDCSGGANPVFGVANQCANIANQAPSSARGHVIFSDGTCPASGGVPDVPPPGFDKKGRACTGSIQPAAACGGDVCVSLAPPAFGSKVCIYKLGEQSCPAAYPARQLIYTAGLGQDSRGCSDCACNYAGGTCEGFTQLFSSDVCTSQVGTAANNEACTGLGGLQLVYSIKVVPTAMPIGGSCTPEGGMPEGTVEGNGAWAVCCQP